MAGDYVENRELKSTATSVATTVAKALRKKELPVWKNALQELQIPAEAYSTIELSFKYLRGEQLKKTFLLCSLITPAPIMDLFKYSMGLGVFKSVHKLEDAHNKLHAWVHQLRDSCLLLEDGGSKYISMHDVVRDVAISIAFRDMNAFVVRNEDDWKWPNADELKKYFAISFKDSIVNDIPEGSESLQLELLFMSPKNSFAVPNIPENFFKRTKKLRVLDLTRMRLLSLPSSIGLLVNLQTLCLNQSIFGGIDIAIIGKLENLEILSFLQSDIVELPKALGQLTKLRLLDLTDCFRLKVIAPNVISSLIRLEELYMGNCFIEWEVERANSKRKKHVGKLAMIKELQLHRHYHLKQLCKQDSKLGPIFQYLEILRVHHCQSLLILLPSSSVSFRNLTKLVALGCKKLIHLVTSSTAKTLVRLISLYVYGCRAMTEVVINDKDGVEKEEIVFRKLKRLELRDLDSLTSFCSANYTFEFPSLQDLSVIGCPKFKIFTTGESSTPPRLLAGSSSYSVDYD
ncbi:hypothetical protein CUMW_272520 [Citrus unshiu]|uniref:Disease resistance protein At4g27190-like leucine-rich repeats domain-containing protein n=1 Tax=Citrus unshiu TaxID=55188 RepID=A0A2H5MV10_CITUN|nr:hypothetical protein CUMW_272520 [Citrus unshiu]